MEKGKIIKMRPEQMMINIISLCIFPFIAKPILSNILDIKDKEEFNDLMNERKKLIPELILTAISYKK